MQANVYVACGLSSAPEEYRAFVNTFKERLVVECSCNLLGFVGLTEGTALEVYTHDLIQVSSCNALIAFVSEPSTGMGMELYKAITLQKPILCLNKRGVRLTRMVIGARDAHHLKLEEYDQLEDALLHAKKFLALTSAH